MTADHSAAEVSGESAPLAPTAYRVSGRLLQVSVIVCILLSAVGLVGFAAGNPDASLSSILPSPAKPPDLSWGALSAGLGAASSDTVLTTVVLILLGVPFARVAIGAVFLSRARDTALAAMAVAVLALLVGALFLLAPLVR